MNIVRLFLAFIFLFLLVLPMCGASSNAPEVKWIWKTDNLWTGFNGNYTISIYNPTSDYVQLERFGLHYPWNGNGVFVLMNANKTILPMGTGEISVSLIVPGNFTTGMAKDFGVFFFYHNSSNISIDGGIFRPQPININRGITVYSEQNLSPDYVSLLFIFSISVCVILYFMRKVIIPVLEKCSKRMTLIIFLTFSLLFISSALTNFYPYYKDNTILQGVPLTGDESHYAIMTHGLLIGKYLSSDIYQPGIYRHDITVYGLLDYNQSIPEHPIGFPIILAPSYALGALLFGSGPLGSSMFMGIITALSLVLIYMITLEITKSVSLSVVSVLVFGLSTLVATWANQLFTESFIGFVLLYISYALLVKKDRHLMLAGFLLGYTLMLKNEMIFQAIVSSIVVFMLLLRYNREKAKKFILPFIASISVFVLYSILFLGSEYLRPTVASIEYSGMPGSIYNIIASTLTNIFGLLIDSDYGALFYSPILILSFVGAYSFFKKCDKTPMAFIVITVVLWCGPVSLVSFWNGWLAPPGRFMMVVLPMLSIPFAYALQRIKTYLIPVGMVLFSVGVVFNVNMLFNRCVDYVMYSIDDVGRSRLLITITKAYKININIFPDFVYHYPQNNLIMYGWSIIFIIASVGLVIVGSRRDLNGD